MPPHDDAHRDTLRIGLWSGPRNVSTALMYSFAQRPDTRVVDEPLYGFYLTRTGADHPGAAEVVAAMDNDGERVVRQVILGPCDRPVLFLKLMGHHLLDLDPEFLAATRTVLLIRDPADVLRTLQRQVPNPDLDATGLPDQIRILEAVEARGEEPVVLDARETLKDPEAILRELCSRLGLAFDQRMLSWPAEPRPEDGVWAPHWYHVIHRSTGFGPYSEKTEPVPERLVPLVEACRPLYERLFRRALRAPGAS